MKTAESETRRVGRLCGLVGRTRQAYYGHLRKAERGATDSYLVLEEVRCIRSEQNRIGVRKLHHMMAGALEGHGVRIGRDALFDLLREHSMLVRRRRSRRPRTTYSALWMKRYPNLAKGFEPVGALQLWVSDITYIRVGEGFCYLSLVTDAYSRKIVGHHLSDDLTARGCVSALKMALKSEAGETTGLIHHSDRGLQYYSSRYMKLLKSARIRVSMSEKSDPLENAIAERVNGVLKQELLARRFNRFDEASREVDKAVRIYNHLRPHLSIDMLTPNEAHGQSGELKRRWKNYHRRPDPAPSLGLELDQIVNQTQDVR